MINANGAMAIDEPKYDNSSEVVKNTLGIAKELGIGFIKQAYKSAKSMVEPYYLTSQKKEQATRIAQHIIDNQEALGAKGTLEYKDNLYSTIQAQSSQSARVQREVGTQLKAAGVIKEVSDIYDTSDSTSFRLLPVIGPKVHVYGLKEGDGLVKNAWNALKNEKNTYRSEFATAGFQGGAALGGVGALAMYGAKVVGVGGAVGSVSETLKNHGINNTAVDLASRAVNAWAYSPLLGAIGFAKEAAYNKAKTAKGTKKDILNALGNIAGLYTVGVIGQTGLRAASAVDFNNDGRSDLTQIVNKTLDVGSTAAQIAGAIITGPSAHAEELNTGKSNATSSDVYKNNPLDPFNGGNSDTELGMAAAENTADIDIALTEAQLNFKLKNFEEGLKELEVAAGLDSGLKPVYDKLSVAVAQIDAVNIPEYLKSIAAANAAADKFDGQKGNNDYIDSFAKSGNESIINIAQDQAGKYLLDGSFASSFNSSTELSFLNNFFISLNFIGLSSSSIN